MQTIIMNNDNYIVKSCPDNWEPVFIASSVGGVGLLVGLLIFVPVRPAAVYLMKVTVNWDISPPNIELRTGHYRTT